MKIVLCSKSPRRKEILNNLGLDFSICSPDCDENLNIASPKRLVCALSHKKAQAVVKQYKEDTKDVLFIAADTVVCIKSEILGKPKDKEDAAKMIKALSGKCHKVITGITLIYNGKTESCFESTSVYFRKISDREIDEYIETPEAYDKAGGYAIQGTASRWISRIKGDYFNVVGLPVYRLCELAKKLNITL